MKSAEDQPAAVKALVTGAAGFIGGSLCAALAKEGVKVRALVRRSSHTRALRNLNVEVVEGDILDQASLA